MSPYQEMLDYAEKLGFSLPGHEPESNKQLAEFEQIVENRTELYDVELRVHQLTGYLQTRSVTDQQQLQSRTHSLEKAVRTCQQVCSNKDTLADRLRSARTRPSVPVAPEYQQDFSALLQHSASSAQMLHEGIDSLQWAATLDAKPSCWEDQLKCILEAAKELDICMTAMERFSTAITHSSSNVDKSTP
eukprot:GHUV01022802.1.p1 GENE.GHUV01022802.1~~GHUV01022802.1.p1  ORF type:complete len:189 (+),score=52.98 GHUV01022802.1:501-1067(+)